MGDDRASQVSQVFVAILGVVPEEVECRIRAERSAFILPNRQWT